MHKFGHTKWYTNRSATLIHEVTSDEQWFEHKWLIRLNNVDTGSCTLIPYLSVICMCHTLLYIIQMCLLLNWRTNDLKNISVWAFWFTFTIYMLPHNLHLSFRFLHVQLSLSKLMSIILVSTCTSLLIILAIIEIFWVVKMVCSNLDYHSPTDIMKIKLNWFSENVEICVFKFDE